MESRLEEIYHFAKFLFEQYENEPNSDTFDLTEYFERIQKVSTWTETDIEDQKHFINIAEIQLFEIKTKQCSNLMKDKQNLTNITQKTIYYTQFFYFCVFLPLRLRCMNDTIYDTIKDTVKNTHNNLRVSLIVSLIEEE